MSWYARGVCALFLVAAAACGGSGGPATCSLNGGVGLASSVWPKFRADSRNTGRSPVALVDESAPAADSAATCEQPGSRCLWRFETGGSVASSPAISNEGEVFVGSSDFKVYALRPDATDDDRKKWQVSTLGPVTSSPALSDNGLVFVGSGDGDLYTIATIDATIARTVSNFFGFIAASPALSSETSTRGVVYIGSLFNTLGALCPNNIARWSNTSIGPIRGTVAIAYDATLYIAGTNQSQTVVALDPVNGAPRWTFAIGAPVNASPVVADDSSIYVAANNGLVLRLQPNGERSNFAFDVRTFAGAATAAVSLTASPAIAAGDQTLYVAASVVRDPVTVEGMLIALDPESGSPRWVYTVPASIDSSPAVSADGTVIFGANDGVVYALRDLGSTPALRWTFTTGGPVHSSPAIDASGRIYIGSDDRFVYALQS